MLFNLGHLVATPGAMSFLERIGISPFTLITRHRQGDWGDLSSGDKKLNDMAIHDGTRILSAYVIDGTKLYVITESDRSYTTVLLAADY